MNTPLRPLSILVALFAALALSGPAAAQVTDLAGVDYEVLSTDAKDPLFIQVAPDGRVFWVEREGRIEVLKPDGTQANVGHIRISANACNETYCPQGETASLEEGGLYSILLDRDFATNGKVYMYYSAPESFRPGDQAAIPGNAYDHVTVCKDPACEVAPNFGSWRLSTFTIGADSKLVPGSEDVIFEVPAEWLHCCHYGGNLEWLPDGTLLLSTGDDIAATAAAYGQTTNPLQGDAEKSSQNPSDRRGKILRLMPDGSVPDGSVPGVKANPFLKTDAAGAAMRDADGHVVTKETEDRYVEDRWGDPSDHIVAFDPYVYSMGYKQPFRGMVHPYTGTAIFDEVGPDAYAPDANRGPRGQEELNEIPFGGGTNHGWPRCSGPNDAYHEYDDKTQKAGPAFDCSKMDPAVVWYPHDVSDRWPILGAGGVTSIPAAFYPANTSGPLRLPHTLDDNLIYLEFSRHSIIGMPVAANGHLVTDMTKWTVIAPPNAATAVGRAGALPSAPIDATVGPDGAIYFLEYGAGFYNGGSSKVSRLKCSGCVDALTRARAVPASPVKTAGPSGLPAWVIVALAGGLLLVVPFLRRRRLVG